jgi:hypothetical protein
MPTLSNGGGAGTVVGAGIVVGGGSVIGSSMVDGADTPVGVFGTAFCSTGRGNDVPKVGAGRMGPAASGASCNTSGGIDNAVRGIASSMGSAALSCMTLLVESL